MFIGVHQDWKLSRRWESPAEFSIQRAVYCTVKFVADAAAPPFVVILTFPVTAPAGTTALTCVSEFTVKVAFTPPIVTTVA